MKSSRTIRLLLAVLVISAFWGWWAYETPNHKRIRFYGLVVDQNDKPVLGATVYITVLYNSLFGAGQKRATIETAPNGTFEVSGYKGRTLDIGLRKEGYDYEGDTGPFQYTLLVGPEAQFHPDEKNPVKFVMWKRKGAEPMVSYDSCEVELPYDNSPHRIDLLKGGIVKEGGDFIVRLSAPPVTVEETRTRHAWDWDLGLEAPEGGFVVSRQKLMSEAPQEGYQPSINLGHKMTDKFWLSQAKTDLYVFSRGKLYTKMGLYFTGNPAFKTGGLSLHWKTNPSGSRNLEYDKTTDVTDQYREKKK